MAGPTVARIRGREVWLRALESSDLPVDERAFEDRS